MRHDEWSDPTAPRTLDWRGMFETALQAALCGMLVYYWTQAPPAPPPDTEAQAAAQLLGVGLDASPDEIRAALRAKLANSRIHPDQGGDGEEARRLMAAKNLLISRARGVP